MILPKLSLNYAAACNASKDPPPRDWQRAEISVDVTSVPFDRHLPFAA